MRITTRGRYGLRAVLKLTISDTGKPISIRELSQAEKISPEFLEQIFFRLRKAGIIKSTRGPGGGFQMDRDPATVTVKEIFDAVGEEVSLTPCTADDGDRAVCDHQSECIAHDIWTETADYINGYFKRLTIQQILDKHTAGVVESVSRT